MTKLFLSKQSALLCVIVLTLAYCSPKKETAQEETTTEEVAAPKEKPAIGLQLYTVRDSMAVDPVKTLERVAALGYTHVELASYDSGKFYGYEPAAFKKLTGDLGLTAISAHIPVVHMEENPELVVQSSAAAGLKYVVLPWLSTEQRESINKYKGHIEVINKIAPMCTEAGLTFAYHNHDFEFDTLEGIVPMEMILAETDPAHVKLEIDLFWVSRMNIDPVDYLQNNGDRVVLWHVKDMDDTPERGFTEVGNGVIDYSAIFKLRENTALEYFFVEQDRSDNALQSIETSYGNVAKILAE